jgi:hypothetical protein
VVGLSSISICSAHIMDLKAHSHYLSPIYVKLFHLPAQVFKFYVPVATVCFRLFFFQNEDLVLYLFLQYIRTISVPRGFIKFSNVFEKIMHNGKTQHFNSKNILGKGKFCIQERTKNECFL